MTNESETDRSARASGAWTKDPDSAANEPTNRQCERRFRLGAFWNSSFIDIAPIDLAGLLRQAGLPEDLYNRRAPLVSAEEYARLWRVLAAQSDDTSTAVALGRSMLAPVPLKPFVIGALCCDTLAEAFQRLSQYRRTVRPVNIRFDESPTHTRIVVTYPSDQRVPAILALACLTFLVELARTATGRPVQPVEATVAEPSVDLTDFQDLVGCDPSVSDRWSVTFADRDLRRPVVVEPIHWVLDMPDELLPRRCSLDDAPTTAAAVRANLCRRLPTGDSRIQRIAADLSVSPRTLQRRLSNEGTSFQTILHETREGMARWLLSHSNLGNEAITFALGYDSTISFFRAFNQWTGTTPDSYRAHLDELGLRTEF